MRDPVDCYHRFTRRCGPNHRTRRGDAGGFFIPEAKETVEMMYEFEQPFIVDSSKFESTFGMKATPMREAIKGTVAWYKSHPQSSH